MSISTETLALLVMGIATLVVIVSKLLDKFVFKNTGSNNHTNLVLLKELHQWHAPNPDGVQEWKAPGFFKQLQLMNQKMDAQNDLLRDLIRQQRGPGNPWGDEGGD